MFDVANVNASLSQGLYYQQMACFAAVQSKPRFISTF